MARHKGFKLSEEQKARMQAGRKAAKAKAEEGMIEGQEKVKAKKAEREIKIIGYAIDRGENEMVYPVFASEENSFRGKLYPTVKKAKESTR
jgi:competence protein ComGF